MAPTALFLLSSHDHAASFIARPGPLSLVVQVTGFLLVLIAAALIVTAVERVRNR